MDSLKGLCNDSPYAQKCCSFGSPIAAAARTVLRATKHQQRCPLFLISLCCSENRFDGFLRVFAGETAFQTRCEQVAYPDVCKRATNHYVVIAPSSYICVEVLRLDAMFLEVLSGICLRRNLSARRDVIGSQTVPINSKGACARQGLREVPFLHEGGFQHVG